MFKRDFLDVIAQTGMVPQKDLIPLLENRDEEVVTELELLEFDFFDDIKFARQISEIYAINYVDLGRAQISDDIINLARKAEVLKYRCIPIQKNAKQVTLAIYDPNIRNMKMELQKLFHFPVEFLLTNLRSWKNLFERVQVTVEDLLGTVREVRSDADLGAEASTAIKEEDIGEDVIEYVNRILVEAYVIKASDIHIEPYEKKFRIRFRIDGELIESSAPSRALMLPIISRIKIMARMDISEKRRPQDGRIKLKISNKEIDYRVSSLPTLFGEKVVMRLLDSSALQLDLTKLGMETKQVQIFKEAISKPYGMCLVTGPTGSGKSTTLYSALSELNDLSTNISTAEDPVEYNLEGINQVNVRKEIGFNFAQALKSFLRQDPDVIMVGEMRDLETAEIAVEASLTGHLVLSTLHTNDAPSTLTRLLNMGIEPFLLTAALNVIVAQRLCRKICVKCKQEQPVSEDELVVCGISRESAKKVKVYHGTGCETCKGTGHKGRIAIHEVLAITPAIREAIIKGANADQIKKIAMNEGMKTLRMAALTKAAMGLITLQEAVKNTVSDRS